MTDNTHTGNNYFDTGTACHKCGGHLGSMPHKCIQTTLTVSGLNAPTKSSGELESIPMVNGLDCPACGHPTLILGNGGYITCSLEGCPNPDYAEALATQTTKLQAEARIDELKRKMTLHVDLLSSKDYKAGFSAALDQIDDANRLRIAQLEREHKIGEDGE